MSKPPGTADIGVDLADHVAVVEIRRGPHNFFDIPMIAGLAGIFEALEADPDCRVILLCAEGKSFCAGADFQTRDATPEQASPRGINPIYFEAVRLFACSKPVVGAIHGPAIGGGLGLALVPDFRVTCPEARFSANFNRLGFHPGFGLSYTLPRLVGPQQAAMLFYTGKRIGGDEAVRIGLADVLVPQAEVRSEAMRMATEIAISSPLAVQSTRATLRAGMVEQIRLAVARESVEQNWQFKTEDFKEGVKAMAERRNPDFKGK
ncbi:enoyl-CoA hydratase/isomerase family protein [Zeimonas arvi]|uniref:Enoyl-CoA hydratase/isomerase family protein n=1 Tax=Zeimonas arvi TaxID=2498847 RepID=A0A5C8P5W8_9BURK|nr:enoyl-CoA hydratase/isomerase family protein [Zeimonas arvi]TXL68625.1 enoyl-CoA hydratase/isomerase family protein [Zeimonas arvi]